MINTNDVVVDEMYINTKDAPDFCDSYIESAYYKSTGLDLTEQEIEELNNDADFVYESVLKQLY